MLWVEGLVVAQLRMGDRQTKLITDSKNMPTSCSFPAFKYEIPPLLLSKVLLMDTSWAV